MSLKTVVTAVLSIFVVVAVGTVVLQSRTTAVGVNPPIANEIDAPDSKPSALPTLEATLARDRVRSTAD